MRPKFQHESLFQSEIAAIEETSGSAWYGKTWVVKATTVEYFMREWEAVLQNQIEDLRLRLKQAELQYNDNSHYFYLFI